MPCLQTLRAGGWPVAPRGSPSAASKPALTSIKSGANSVAIGSNTVFHACRYSASPIPPQGHPTFTLKPRPGPTYRQHMTRALVITAVQTRKAVGCGESGIGSSYHGWCRQDLMVVEQVAQRGGALPQQLRRMQRYHHTPSNSVG